MEEKLIDNMFAYIQGIDMTYLLVTEVMVKTDESYDALIDTG